MKLTKENISQILSLWTHVEALTPFDLYKDMLRSVQPDSVDSTGMSLFTWDQDDKRQRDRLQVEINKLPQGGSDRNRYIRLFTICLGVISRNDFISRAETLLRSNLLDISHDLTDFSSEELKTNDLICLGVLRANHFGKLVKGTMMPSFALAELHNLSKKAKGGQIPETLTETVSFLTNYSERFLSLESPENFIKKAKSDKDFFGTGVHRLKKEELRNEEGPVKELTDLLLSGSPMNLEKLDSLCKEWLEFAGLGPNYQIWVAINHYEYPRTLTLDFMNSPYIRFIESQMKRVKAEEAEKILSHVSKRFFRLSYDNTVRKDILSEPEKFLELASPKKMPLGRWPQPDDQFLVPTQQVAVASMLECDPYYPIVSVNGPPGTGKTTILKELVADIVIRRAYALSRITEIGTESLFTDRPGYQGATVPVLNADYSADYTILVASNNNNAVENITKELPYEYGFSESADYFSVLANALNRTSDAWGLLSAPLGKIDNWTAFWKALFSVNKKIPGAPYFLTRVIEKEIQAEGGPAGVRKAWAKERRKFQELLRSVADNLKDKWAQYKEDKVKFNTKEDTKEEKLSDLIFTDEAGETRNPFDFSGSHKEANHAERLYTDPELDRQRTRLFLSALRLHKLVILAKKKEFVDGIRGAIEVNVHDLPSPYRAEFLGTISFLVPVISTTFAASAYRFLNFATGSIPWVVVDEASQATPQSAFLLMQKAKRFIVLGDPMQLQPVVTLPYAISELLCGKNEFLRKWSPHLKSLQLLSVGTQDYGAWVGSYDTRIWSGLPLRLQRRSHPPMFNICNEIAYSGQMVLPEGMRVSEIPEGFVQSFWLDVAPKVPSESNCVAEEVEALGQVFDYLERSLMLKHFNGLLNEKKTVLVCTPFRTTAYQLRKLYGKCERTWLKVERLGTVHTLQGKQSDIVIFVLGSKTGNKGFGARSWATAAPNLFNVAVSRAKETLIVIGNIQDWKAHNYVGSVLRQLESYGRGVLKTSDLHSENNAP